MRFKVRSGRKGKDDRILFSVCPFCLKEEALLLSDLIKWARFKYRNEELIYPYPQRGGEKIKDFINTSLRNGSGCEFIYSIDQLLELFQIDKIAGKDYQDTNGLWVKKD